MTCKKVRDQIAPQICRTFLYLLILFCLSVLFPGNVLFGVDLEQPLSIFQGVWNEEDAIVM